MVELANSDAPSGAGANSGPPGRAPPGAPRPQPVVDLLRSLRQAALELRSNVQQLRLGSGQGWTGQRQRPGPGSRAPPSPDPKAELGRGTWTLLHTLAAQLPDAPTRSQKKDVQTLVRAMAACLERLVPGRRELAPHTMSGQRRGNSLHAGGLETRPLPASHHLPLPLPQITVLTRIYPCADCAQHFAAIVRCE